MLLELYHRLPPQARSVPATLRGMYLRWWRYGPDTERLVSEALRRESWSPEQWTAWQNAELRDLLRHAAAEVPWYRDWWARHKHLSCERLEDWPILGKEDLRRYPDRFLARSSNKKKLFCEHTSGSTGTPLTLWWSRETTQRWYALFEARWRRWNGVSRQSRWAILGGQLVAPSHQTDPPFWVYNAAFRQLYLSSYHLKPEWMGHYLDAIEQYGTEYLWGYSSALYTVATAALEMNRRPLGLRTVLTNGEPLEEHQRKAMERAFGCPVRETYGMSEIVTAASQCSAGVLHVWPEVGVLEVLGDDNQPVAPGATGDLIGTGLLNRDMPLIRYRTGDRGALGTSAERCLCGRLLPVMRCIEGRADDVLYTTDGRAVGRLDPVLKADFPVVETQIIQETRGRIRVRYVPAPDFSEASAAQVTKRLQQRLGMVEVVWERMDRIPRGANGKFHAVLCTIPDDERPQTRSANHQSEDREVASSDRV